MLLQPGQFQVSDAGRDFIRHFVRTGLAQEVEVSPSIGEIEAALNELVTVPLHQKQVDALASLLSSVGLGAFRSGLLLKQLNRGELIQAANSFVYWRYIGENGHPLKMRHEAERGIFLEPLMAEMEGAKP